MSTAPMPQVPADAFEEVVGLLREIRDGLAAIRSPAPPEAAGRPRRGIPAERQWLTKAEARRVLGVAKRTLEAFIADGLLPVMVGPGGRPRLARAAVERVAREGVPKIPAPGPSRGPERRRRRGGGRGRSEVAPTHRPDEGPGFDHAAAILKLKI